MTTLERGSSRLIRLALRAGAAPRAFALLETTGRCTGLARANPRVRVKADGAWRAGTAVAVPGDEAAARPRRLPCQWDAAIGRMMASAPLTVRIGLDPAPSPVSRGSTRARLFGSSHTCPAGSLPFCASHGRHPRPPAR
jgi:hypothetical protein